MHSLMEILQHAMEAFPRDSIKTYNVKILSLFLKAFDVRSFKAEESLDELQALEGTIVGAFCTLIMKLSENLFRPMFLKVSYCCTRNFLSSNAALACCMVTEKL